MKNKICKILGENIKKIRKAKGLKQETLAELIGLEVKSLSLIETGNGFATAKTLEKLMSVLNVSVSELFEENEPQSAEQLYFNILSNLELIKNNTKKLRAINLIIKSWI